MKPAHGLYLVTPDWNDTARLLKTTRAALQGGAKVLQYRNKLASPTLRLLQAKALRALTREFGVCLFINDEPALALAAEADGVHLGRDDGALEAARSACGNRLLIGVSCYDDFARARTMAALGADYIAFGAMFASPTKPEAESAPLSLIGRAKAELDVPVACIGGITADNALPLVQSGADWLAVISDVYQAADPEARAHQLASLFA